MTHNLFSFLHVAPLFVIAALFALSVLSKAFSWKKLNSSYIVASMLIMAAIGIVSGSGVHDHAGQAMELLDPCFGYAITLLYAAAKVRKFSASSIKA